MQPFLESLGLSLPITDPVLTFATVMVIVLVAPLLFKRLGVPGIVGLIVFGAVAGESVLGLLQVDNTFELLGRVGLLYLMFTAGLSLDLNQFVKYKSRSLVFGLLSFLFPMALALSVGVQLLNYETATALLIGAVVGSHTLLAYPIAEKLGITKNLAVTMTMGGTMVTDLVSLLVLAIVAATVEGATGLGFWATFAGVVLAYGVLVALLLPRLGRWFFRNVRNQPDMEFVFLLAVVFVTAYMAQVAYLAPIIGAFFAGIILNRLVPERSPLMLRIKFVGDALFVPFFLVYVGLLVDVAVLVEGTEVVLLALILAAVVWVGKLIAAKGVQWLYAYTPDEGWAIFGLSTPQSAATLAVTLVGFELGLFDEALLNAVVVLILLTCLVGPWVVERFGRRVAIQEEQKPYEASEAPQRILVPLANPETSEDLVDMAVYIRNPNSEEPVYPLSIAREGGNQEAEVAAAEQLLSRAVLHAATADVPVRPGTRIDLNVANGVRRAIDEYRISTVVIGWSGDNTARRYIFGSVLDQLLEETEEMVLVCRITQPLNTIRRMLLAIPPYADREPGFADAVRAMKIMANQIGAELLVLTTATSARIQVPVIQALRPEVPVEPIALTQWSDLMRTLDETVKEDDLFSLLSVRSGSVAWRASLDRLPRLIAQRFAQTSDVTLYAPERPVSKLTQTGQKRPQTITEDMLQVSRLRSEADAQPAEQVMEQVLAQDMGLRPETAQHLAASFTEDGDNYAPELMAGAALYHLHLPLVADEPLLVAGLSAEGLSLPRTSQPVHVLLILLVPKTASTDRYLDLVTGVAKLLTREKVETLRTTDDIDEARRLLLEPVQTPAVASP
ncbi:MAG: universal stress protein [Bacteroidetes bacterium]|jgi:Kef-type K+ transport system membrane component KefB|nr:universal stress protein [Bacteroidota bacterium]